MNKRRRKSMFSQYRPLFFAIALGAALLFMWRVQDQSPKRYFVVELAEHPAGSATPYVPNLRHLPPFYLVHTPGGDVLALVRLPPRGSCLVEWQDEQSWFEAPCNGLRYDWHGVALGHDGPSLDRLDVEVTEVHNVLIDMGQRIAGPAN